MRKVKISKISPRRLNELSVIELRKKINKLKIIKKLLNKKELRKLKF